MSTVPGVESRSTAVTVDMYTAPVDVNIKILPGKIWEEKPMLAKFRGERDTSVCKDVYVEQGKRKVPRDGVETDAASRLQARQNVVARGDKTGDSEDMGIKACRSLVDLEDCSLFDVDLNYVEPKKEFPGPYDPERVRQLYSQACKTLELVPSSLFRNGLDSGRVIAGHQGMGPLGAKAVAISLITNLTVTELIIPDNKIGPQGMQCIAKLIHGNEIIKVLDVSDNDLGREGAKVLAQAIKENESIQQINTAGNKFDDKTGSYFEEALKINTTIKQLDLSRNLFCEQAAICIARGLEDNFTVTHLDLSYNHIRRNGIKGIAKMLMKNRSLLNLDLSWNGVGTQGATSLGEGMNQNNSLAVLNVTGCRMNGEALITMLGKMKDNRILKAIQIKNNPITNADLDLYIRAIELLPDSAINFVDAGSVVVSAEFLNLVKRVGTTRPGFVVMYRSLLSIKDQARNMMENLDWMSGDPLEALIKYTRSKNLRLVDLFARFDVDKSGSMTRQELIHGVADAGIPLSIKQMDRLVAKLDKDGDGEIDFSELLEGYKKYMRDLHKQGKVARNVLKMEMEAFPGLLPSGKATAVTTHISVHTKTESKDADRRGSGISFNTLDNSRALEHQRASRRHESDSEKGQREFVEDQRAKENICSTTVMDVREQEDTLEGNADGSQGTDQLNL